MFSSIHSNAINGAKFTIGFDADRFEFLSIFLLLQRYLEVRDKHTQ
jgi:hypothetical protein